MRVGDIVSVVAILGWTVVAIVYRDSHYDGWALFASIAVLAAALAFFRWSPSPGKEGFRLLGLTVCAQSFISAGMSVIADIETTSLYVTPKEDAFSAAVWSTVMFSFLFLAGALITAPRAAAVLADDVAPRTGLRPVVALVLAGCTTLTTIAYIFFPSIGSLGTLPLVVFNGSLVAPMLTAQATLTRQRSLLPLAVLMAGHAAVTFYTSLLGSIVFVMRDILLARIYMKRAVPKAFVAAMIAIVVILNPAKAIFRAALATGPARTTSGVLDFGQASTLWGDAVSSTWSAGKHGSHDRSEGLRATTSRLNYNWVSAHVFSVVPYRVPFQSGATYSIIPAVLVPRILYPDKPNTATYGRAQWFIKLGIQDRRSVETAAFALPAPAEAYWNYGWPGVFVVPLVLGAMVGLLLRTGPRDPVARVGYIVLLATSLGQFLDMVVWIIPNFFVVAAGGLLTLLYCRLGHGKLLHWGSATAKRATPPRSPVDATSAGT